ncbi:hypothetical protein J4Q44_G00355020 [Coregonus suidteri]|uniref:Cytosolic iron-sulfur assembly component 2B n=1 Tax=Coregonus suidteri TaxID=861788 RepID=A0AAN8KNQ2_9TELE
MRVSVTLPLLSTLLSIEMKWHSCNSASRDDQRCLSCRAPGSWGFQQTVWGPEALSTSSQSCCDVTVECHAETVLKVSLYLLKGSINDPEHPLSLEELNVVEQVRVRVNDQENTVGVEFTPTIPHCSMATLIGLSIKVKLLRSLPERFKIDVHITPGTHASEDAVNKQLADKERVAAALENSQLLEVVNQCLISNARTG